MPTRMRLHEDDGAVAVLFGVLFAFVLLPLLVLGTTTYVRSTTAAELQRASDSGALAGAATIPFGNAHFALDYIDATSGGATTDTLDLLGLDYPYPDPLQVACDQARHSASDPHNVGYVYALDQLKRPMSCQAEYVKSDLVGAAMACASALGVQPPPLPGQPDLSTLLPALLTPGIHTTVSWQVAAPMDKVTNSGPSIQTVSSVARRRFKDMVVAPLVTAPAIGGGTDTVVNVNPFAGDVRTFMSSAIDGTEQTLRQTPGLGPCAQMLDNARGDILDAVDPPSTGPQFTQILDAAAADSTPAMIAGVVESTSVPYLEFFPACIDASGGPDAYVGHLSTFGDCTVVSPGAFRASLRRS